MRQALDQQRILLQAASQFATLNRSRPRDLNAGGKSQTGERPQQRAFFPFPDGVQEIAKAGATAVIQPGGSVRDQEVIDTADRLGLAMVLTGVRHFRH